MAEVAQDTCDARHQGLDRQLGGMQKDIEGNSKSINKLGERVGALESKFGVINTKLDNIALALTLKADKAAGDAKVNGRYMTLEKWSDIVFKLLLVLAAAILAYRGGF